jgi:hypothetical protein
MWWDCQTAIRQQRFDKSKVFSSRSAPPIRLGFPATLEVVGHDPPAPCCTVYLFAALHISAVRFANLSYFFPQLGDAFFMTGFCMAIGSQSTKRRSEL